LLQTKSSDPVELISTFAIECESFAQKLSSAEKFFLKGENKKIAAGFPAAIFL
jgi:hypothetical protein